MPLLLAVAALPRAADAVISHSTFSLTGGANYSDSPTAPCPCLASSGGQGFATLSGAAHVVVRVEPAPPGSVSTAEVYLNVIDVVGTGLTGCPYRGVGAEKASSPTTTPGSVAYSNTYELLAPPSCPHGTMQVNGQIYINADGTMAQFPETFFFIGPPR